MRNTHCGHRTTQVLALAFLIAFEWSHIASAQRPSVPPPSSTMQAAYSHSPALQYVPAESDLGTLVRSGRVQIVRFETPAGTNVEIASSAGVVQFAEATTIGLAVGPTYRLRVTHASERLHATLYPTLRLIGYTMPPANVDPLSYPVPIHFIDRDFDEATEGRLVSNVVYLEDPISALPIAFPRGEIPVVDLGPGQDVLFKSSAVGRPIVFIQLGNRVPLDNRFEDPQNDPPVLVLPSGIQAVGSDALSGVQTTGWTRLPVPMMQMTPGFGCRPSAPACTPNQPVVRLPTKIHPRMPRDEYVCDGGDEVPYAHLTGPGLIDGLGASETVAQFTRPGEGSRLVVSNQVCVYAPRFGLMRSSSVSLGSLQIEGARGVDYQLRRGAVEGRAAVGKRTESKQVLALRRRERLSSLKMNEPVAALDETRVIDAVYNRDGVDKAFSNTGPIKLGQADDPRIAMSIEAAKVWNRVQYPAYTALTEGGSMITGRMQTGEIQQVREPHRRPGELVLTKLATPQNAHQGDEIEFTIYFRNIGEKPVESVSIIDSLTARLEYLPDSAQSDHRAVFTAAPNDVQSQELRWDLNDPVPGGQGGVVWFKAKVR